MKFAYPWLLCATLGLFGCGIVKVPISEPTAQMLEHESPVKGWHLGDSWKIAVARYSQNWMFQRDDANQEIESPSVVYRYTVTVRVAGTIKVGDVECWAVDFLAGDDAPETVRKTSYSISLSKHDGAWMEFWQITGEKRESLWVYHVADIPFIFPSPYGYPVEILLVGPAREIASPESLAKVTLTEKEAGNNHVYTCAVKGGAINMCFTQEWDPNALWWTSYERSRDGHIELRCNLLAK